MVANHSKAFLILGFAYLQTILNFLSFVRYHFGIVPVYFEHNMMRMLSLYSLGLTNCLGWT